MSALNLIVAKGGDFDQDEMNVLASMMETSADECIKGFDEDDPNWSRTVNGWELVQLYKLASQLYDHAANMGGHDAVHFRANRVITDGKANTILKKIDEEKEQK